MARRLIDLVQPVRIECQGVIPQGFSSGSKLVSQFCCGDTSCTLQENKFLLLVHPRCRNPPNSLMKLNEENKRAKRPIAKPQHEQTKQRKKMSLVFNTEVNPLLATFGHQIQSLSLDLICRPLHK